MKKVTLKDAPAAKPPRNPVELEAALNLPRGKVHLIISKSDGVVEVQLDDSVNWPDAVLKDKLEKALNKTVA